MPRTISSGGVIVLICRSGPEGPTKQQKRKSKAGIVATVTTATTRPPMHVSLLVFAIELPAVPFNAVRQV
jgi:hypothetical protein